MLACPKISQSRSEKIYILGTSTDINGLSSDFFRDNVTIGINQSFLVAEKRHHQLTYWICLDEFFKFFDWILKDSSPNTIKFVPRDYFGDPRLLPAQQRFGTDKIVDYVPTGLCEEKLHKNLDKDGLVPYLHQFPKGYTIHIAVSLAVALGAKDIRLRGVSLGGDYADRPIQMARDFYYDDIRNIFLKIVKPTCQKLSVSIKNETLESDFQL